MTKPNLRDEIRRVISNAYYHARNAGYTMEQAADNAADDVMQLLRPKAKTVVLEGDRDGETFDPRRDADRLNKQMRAVWDLMKDGKWRTPVNMEYEIGAPWASISARLRDFRKPKFGGLEVEKRYVNFGIWEYRLVLGDK